MTKPNSPHSDPHPTRKGTEALLDRGDPVVYSDTTGKGPIDGSTLKGYEENGFLTIDKLLAGDELKDLQTEMNRLLSSSSLVSDKRVIKEKGSNAVRSIFEVHKLSKIVAGLVGDERIVGRARQILGSDVYIHQSRVNYKPGFGSDPFYWHSDFETWHAEDGMPRMRAVSISIALTENFAYNGPLMIMPGSHKFFASCAAETPDNNYETSLQEQEAGTPSNNLLLEISQKSTIKPITLLTGKAGSAVMFDSNCMHGSNGNITPDPRSNLFIVFNSVENICVEPFSAKEPRPDYIGSKDFTPV